MLARCLRFAFLISLVAMTACGGTTDNQTTDLVDNVLALHGINSEADRYPEMIQQTLVQYQQQVAPETYEALGQVLSEAFDAQLLKDDVRQHFLDNYDEEKLKEIKKALETSLGQKMVDMQVAAAAPEAIEQMEAFMMELQADPPPPERLTLIENLDATSRYADLSMAMIMGAIRGAGVAFGPELDPVSFAREGFIDSAIAGMRPQIEPNVTLSSRMHLLYTYRDATDEELTEYIGIWETESGQWFTGVLVDAVTAAVAAGNDRTAEQVAQRS
jgi:hypothetical protein